MYRQQQLADLLSGRRILVAGYGREGRSTHALLQRLLPAGQPDIACNDEEIAAALQRAAEEARPYDLIIKSPGISTMKFEGRCALDTITSQTDLFLQVYGDQTIAVTGTKGKSTTTTLICHMLQTAFDSQSPAVGFRPVLAGNMGIPLFDILDQLDESSLVVAEFSCHQLENIHRGPHVGVLLNLFQEHLDHYHDYMGYKMAKMQMMLRQQPGDHCYYCADCAELAGLVDRLLPRIVSRLHPYSLEAARKSAVALMPSALRGDHNLSNIFVVHEVGRLFGISDTCFARMLASFQGLPHRLERVAAVRGVTFYNDSISTIPEAAVAAVRALQKVDTLILGGFDRGIDYTPLRQFLTEPGGPGARVRHLVFVGAAGRRMQAEWQLLDREVLQCDDYAQIVPWCFEHTAQGMICLLSPAAASYDAFKNFEERGTVYKELIQQLS